KNKTNLLSHFEHGDADIELEFMMAKHSNSGIYLQGRYEVQLYDSWGTLHPAFSDCGGIYKRFRPDGSQFEGHAPLINACKAPGTWQKMKISFQAPRFDESGMKTHNAKILYVDLNGYRIHENIELTGPTGGPVSEKEVEQGPLMIQGDHGPVAFRNIKIMRFQDIVPELQNIKYTLYKGDIFDLRESDFSKATSKTGKLKEFELPTVEEEYGWAVVYTAKVTIPVKGKYTFGVQASGHATMKVNGKEVIPNTWSHPSWGAREGSEIELTEGVHDVEIMFAKVDNWQSNYLGLYIRGDKMRSKPLYSGVPYVSGSGGDAPVFLHATKPTVSRGFMRIGEGDASQMVTRSVNVGSPSGMHFSVNLENGALFQLWRGDFLNMSSMWNGRGNASAVPNGVVLSLSNNSPLSGKLTLASLGYDIDEDQLPVFRYKVGDAELKDKITPLQGKEVKREINHTIAGGGVWILCEEENISDLGNGLYNINDQTYFIRASIPGVSIIKSENGKMQLTAPLSNKNITYSIIW
ncbi:MAG: DUF1080 domain-containing protein, partial [Cyclobacteriaceae bacterium]|nr:DUF1080 domain-containing protein [Cyclobacteriaceae bacterium]